MKLAYCSPLPPSSSGISEFSIRLLHGLIDRFDIRCYYDGEKPLLPEKLTPIKTHHYQLYAKHQFAGRNDITLYQFGNSFHHHFMYELVQAFPGIIDLHDANVHHFISHIHSRDPDDRGYSRILMNKMGPEGYRLGVMSQCGVFGETQNFLFELGDFLWDTSLAVIVHSHSAARTVTGSKHDVPVFVIPPPMETFSELPDAEKNMVKMKLNIPEGSLLYCVFGEILPKKGCYEILTAMHHIMERDRNVYCVFVGRSHESFDGTACMKHSPCSDRIFFPGFVSNSDYDLYMNACDCGINLRYPSVGETSQTLLELMAHGKPVIISRTDENDQYPGDAVFRIPVGKTCVEDLVRILRKLNDNKELRQSTGSAARHYIKQNHKPAKVFDMYEHCIRQTAKVDRQAMTKYAMDYTMNANKKLLQIIGQRIPSALCDSDFLEQLIKKLALSSLL